MVVHGTNDPTVPYCEAVALKNWATSAGLPLDFQALTGAGHVPSLHNHKVIHCCSPDIGQLPGKMPPGFRWCRVASKSWQALRRASGQIWNTAKPSSMRM